MNLEVSGPEELDAAASQLLNFAQNEKVFLFYGDMGAGKTSFVKALCRILNVTGYTSSPTFAIVNEYSSPSGPVFHFDFYRLKSETEALDMGYEDYIWSGNYCFIEWPDQIGYLIPEKYCKVEIDVTGPQSRIIRAEIVTH
jgi:tRNA threonylcarbamoyladenosine biosynthesis protein TsaE